jgi:hypothetical protein
MRVLRRRLASCALAVTALQLALLFAAPASACCAGDGKAIAHARATVDAGDCCPAGSHPPGECPLHKGQKSTSQRTSRVAQCRMMCDAPHGVQIVFGAIGILPAPQLSDLVLASSAIPVLERAVAIDPAAFPEGPPPRLL